MSGAPPAPPSRSKGTGALIVQRVAAFFGAAFISLLIFLVLPLMQTIGAPRGPDLMVRNLDVALEPPPPPTMEEEPEPEEEPPPPPPKLESEAPPLDLSALELSLNPGMGAGGFGDFAIDIGQQLAQQEEQMSDIFSLADLDKRPRVIYNPAPRYPTELRRAGREGTVYIVFLVDEQGRVASAKVDRSTDPAFEKSALEAVRKWRFEPATRNGKKVQFKIKIPISFDAG